MNLRKRLLDLVIIVLIAGAVVLLWFVNPSHSVYMPKCPWRLLTHTSCPSCGNTRAAYYLLHGDFLQALMFNPFLLVSIPFLLLAIWVYRFDTRLTLKIRNSTIVSKLAIVYVVLFILWWIVRNIIGM